MRPQSYVTNPLGWIEPLGLSNSSILDKAMEGQVGDKLSAHYVIPREKGAAIKREGSAFTEPGMPHYKAIAQWRISGINIGEVVNSMVSDLLI
ncbi:hypothetical protein PEC311524_41020 [Pectobacterium carotovorum subsp. carotovorum]|nr:hypothetical protein PEC311524_41020 [Pectobacterium carotovorum subsp. carotovorum]